jgi:hypothetical protein
MQNSNFSIISSWYSTRGAKRGFILAIILTAFWLCWAIGFIQGYDHHLASVKPLSLEIVPDTAEKNNTCISQSI